MRRILSVLVLGSIPAFALAQSAEPNIVELLGQQQTAQSRLSECIKHYSLQFANTSAAPSDVVEAALAACNSENGVLLAASTKLTGSIDRATEVVDRAQHVAQRAAIRALLEQRYGIR